MFFENEEEYQVALRDFKKLYPWIDGLMAEILLKTPTEKLDEIWEQVKHNKFKKETTDQFIYDSLGFYDKEEDVPPPPTTLSAEELEACKTKTGELPKLVLEERIVECS